MFGARCTCIPVLLSTLTFLLFLVPEAKPLEPFVMNPELRQKISAVLQRGHVPGASIAVVEPNEEWIENFGVASVKTKAPITTATIFRLGSIGKTFIAAALFKLQEQGKIDLNAKLSEVIPEIQVKNPWEATHPVRVIHLLEHTAGFDDMRLSQIYNVRDPADISLRRVIERFPRPQRVRWPPGTRMAYSNPGFLVAGYVIEKVSGVPFEQFVRQQILDPLGMRHSGYVLSNWDDAHLADGHDGNSSEVIPYRETYMRPGGAIKGTTTDMVALLRLFLGRGSVNGKRILSETSIHRMERPETTDAARAGLEYGEGPAVTLYPQPLISLGHGGAISGFVSDFEFVPDLGAGYVILLNCDCDDAIGEISGLLFDAISRGTVRRTLTPVNVAIHDLQQYSGFYEPRSSRAQLGYFLDLLTEGRRVVVHDGALLVEPLLAPPAQYLPITPTIFQKPDDATPTLAFFREDDAVHMTTPWRYYTRVNPVWPYLRIALIGLAVVAMLSSILAALFWIPTWLLTGNAAYYTILLRFLPLLAVLAVIAMFVAFGEVRRSLDPYSVAAKLMFVFSIVFPVCSAVALLWIIRTWSVPIRRVVRFHSLSVALACCGFAAYLGYWGLLGFRPWDY